MVNVHLVLLVFPSLASISRPRPCCHVGAVGSAPRWQIPKIDPKWVWRQTLLIPSTYFAFFSQQNREAGRRLAEKIITPFPKGGSQWNLLTHLINGASGGSTHTQGCTCPRCSSYSINLLVQRPQSFSLRVTLKGLSFPWQTFTKRRLLSPTLYGSLLNWVWIGLRKHSLKITHAKIKRDALLWAAWLHPPYAVLIVERVTSKILKTSFQQLENSHFHWLYICFLSFFKWTKNPSFWNRMVPD